MPDFYGADAHWSYVSDSRGVRKSSMQADLLLEGPFSIQEGYQHWIKGGRVVPVEYEGQEVLVPAPFSPKGITIEVFEKVFVQRAMRQT